MRVSHTGRLIESEEGFILKRILLKGESIFKFGGG